MGATVSQITGVSTVYSLLLAIKYNQNLELTSLVKVATDVRFNIYMSLQYRNSHYEYQTISWFIFMIHIHDRNSYAGKTAWYWDQISTYTMKPVCNDHLYTKMYYLWFIQ